jgi:hypothetical protein
MSARENIGGEDGGGEAKRLEAVVGFRLKSKEK